jgi:hypothetical protein
VAESQEETQDSIQSSGDGDFPLDEALVAPEAQAMMDARQVVINKKINDMGLSSQEEPEQDEDFDVDVDVGGPSQFEPPPQPTPDLDNSTDVVEHQLSQIAEDYGVRLSMVKAYFEEVEEDAVDLEEAFDETREFVKQHAQNRRKNKPGKGREGSARVR